jgi:molybdenum cofactor biosynthesis enzyme MoaA
VLRGGGDDDELAEVVKACVWRKWAGHGIGSLTFVQPPRTMSQIGG